MVARRITVIAFVVAYIYTFRFQLTSVKDGLILARLLIKSLIQTRLGEDAQVKKEQVPGWLRKIITN